MEKSMTDKQKIADLEKRVKDLEARPQAPTIIVLPANPFPAIPQYPVYPPPRPWWEQPGYVSTCGTNITAGDVPVSVAFTPSPIHIQLGLS